MKRQIRRTKQARQDLIDIYCYLYARSPQAAENVLDAIQESIRFLLDAPGIGRQWNSPSPRLQGMRVVPVKPYRNYLVFFRATSTGIEVIRVIHGKRDLERIVDEIEIEFASGDAVP